MVWTHWHCEIWATVGCGKPRWVCSVVRKWVEDKQNVDVVRWANNQAPTFRLAHEQRCAHMISEGSYTKSETNSCSCSQFAKKTSN